MDHNALSFRYAWLAPKRFSDMCVLNALHRDCDDCSAMLEISKYSLERNSKSQTQEVTAFRRKYSKIKHQCRKS